MWELPWVYFSANPDSEPGREAVDAAILLAFAGQGFGIRWRAGEATREAVFEMMEFAFAWVHIGSLGPESVGEPESGAGDPLSWEKEAAMALGLPRILLMPDKAPTANAPGEAGAEAKEEGAWTNRYAFAPGDPDALSQVLHLAAAALAEDRDRLMGQEKFRLPPPVSHFTGREVEVAWLVERLSKARPGDRFSLIGPGGMGKTAIARAALERLKEKFPGGIYLHDFYAAPTRRAFEDSILGENHGDSQDDLREEIVHNLLWAEGTLVYLEGMEKLRENARGDLISNIFKSCGRAVVLLTSRNSFDGWQTKSLEIDVLPAAEAARLLQAHAGRPSEGAEPVEAYAQLAELLGRQPLALTVAGSMLQHAAGSAESYVREMMQEGMHRMPEEQRTMAVLHWLFRRKALALPSLAREAWMALALHGMCLTRAEMLAACLGKREAEIPPLMKLLEDRGLAIREMLPRQTGYGVESAWRPAHALMSDWARLNLGKCGVDEAGVTARWMDYWSHVWQEELHWSYMGGDGAWRAFICTHLRTWLAHLEPRAVPEKRLLAYRRCGQIYQMMGRVVEGLPCARQEVALATRLHGPEHPETLDAICELAWFVAHDDRGKAIDMLQDVLAMAGEREGPGSPVACNARHTLASVLLLRRYRQDEARAIALLDENLALTQEAHGGQAGKWRLSSLIQLGWYLYGKNHPDAPAHFRDVLECYPQDDHPDGRLRPDFVQAGAVLLDQAGFSDEALENYQRAEAIFSKIAFCAEPLWTLRGGIAERLAKMERWEEAEAVALRQWEASLGFTDGALAQREALDLLTAIQNRQLPQEMDEHADDPA